MIDDTITHTHTHPYQIQPSLNARRVPLRDTCENPCDSLRHARDPQRIACDTHATRRTYLAPRKPHKQPASHPHTRALAPACETREPSLRLFATRMRHSRDPQKKSCDTQKISCATQKISCDTQSRAPQNQYFSRGEGEGGGGRERSERCFTSVCEGDSGT